MKTVYPALVALLLTLGMMTSSHAMSVETQQEVQKMMGEVVSDLDDMMEVKKGESPAGRMSQQTKDEMEVLKGFQDVLKSPAEIDPPSFDSYLNPVRRKRGFFDRFRNGDHWRQFGRDLAVSFKNRLLNSESEEA